MSLIQKEGKDTIIFATKEDHANPSEIDLPEIDSNPGLMLPNGEINWNCPCLGGLATGPCGIEFREAFSCFQNSTEKPKGSDCYEAFKTMQSCMSQYPTVYGDKKSDEDEAGGNDNDENNIQMKISSADDELSSDQEKESNSSSTKIVKRSSTD